MIENAYSYMLEAALREARRREASPRKRGLAPRHHARVVESQVTMRSEHGNAIVVRSTRRLTDTRRDDSLRIACMREAWADKCEVREGQWARRASECKHVLDAYLANTKNPSKAGAVHELNRYRERDGGFMSEMDIDLDITRYFLKRILKHLPVDPLYNKIRLVRVNKKYKRLSRTARQKKDTYDTRGNP